MSIGKRRFFKGKDGLTLVELILVVILMGMIFLAVGALRVAGYAFYLKSNDTAIAVSEFQYATEHIYRNVMMGMGDETLDPDSRAINVPDAETLNITINNNNPLSMENYSDTTVYSYSKSDTELLFDDGTGSDPKSLVSKVSLTDVSFSLDGNVLTVSLTGTYRDQTVTFYSACYPRLSTFR